jgi:3-deoxy-D-manno-octulosonic-acid transferase
MILYNLIIRSYNLLLKIFSLFNRKARLIVRGRKSAFRTIQEARHPDDRIIWFHCASLGEFEQGRPVMEALKKGSNSLKIFVSFFSSSGYEIKKTDPMLDGVFYLPADTRSNARKLVSMLEPEIAIFIKYEFWYHFFKACKRKNIPVISISTILRPDQLFFRPYGMFYRNVLKKVDVFFVQNEETRDLLQGIGIRQVSITGDTRFDRVFRIRSEHVPIPVIEDFLNGKRLVILGSTWEPDIDLWKGFINENQKNYKFLIAPHHVEEADIRYIEDQIFLKSIRYSKIKEVPAASIELIIMDRIGLLSSLYYYGYVNYVGGSLSEGLHNLLEPAVYGAPVLLGRAESNEKYQEAVDLVAMGGAYEISDPDELDLVMRRLSGDEHVYWDAGEKAKKYVESNLGATSRIVSAIETMLRRGHGRNGI